MVFTGCMFTSSIREDRVKEKLNVLSFGAGAIGTYIGGSLALAGHHVVFIERPAVAQELRQRGLRLQIDERESVLENPEVAGSIEEALQQGPFDVGLFALKSYDTQDAVEALIPYREQIPPILCLQNGVDNEATIARAIGADKVIAGTVTSAIGRRAAGDIVLERMRGIGIAVDSVAGQASEGASGDGLANHLVGVMNEAGLNARLYVRAQDMKWSKMLTNLLANATSAILDMTPAQIFDHPGLHELEVRQLREALRVMEAHKIQVVDLPGTPVRVLAFGVRNLPPKVSRPVMKNAVGGGRGGKMPSFHIDLHSGRGKSEVEYLNGAVVRHGQALGVPTPVNRLLTETLTAITSGELSKEIFARQPKRLLDRLALLKK